MSNFGAHLETLFRRLGFSNYKGMTTIAEYPEDLAFLQSRETNLGTQRNPTDFIDFNFVILYPKLRAPEIMCIQATLHLVEPGTDKIAWVASEKEYWEEDGPFPTKAQIIQEVLAGEKLDLLANVREMSKK